MVVAAALGTGGRGPYTLTISTDDSIHLPTEQQRKSAEALVQWVGGASSDDLLAAWRGSSPADLQLACLNRARFQTTASARASVRGRALGTCTTALKEATEARRCIAAGKR